MLFCNKSFGVSRWHKAILQSDRGVLLHKHSLRLSTASDALQFCINVISAAAD